MNVSYRDDRKNGPVVQQLAEAGAEHALWQGDPINARAEIRAAFKRLRRCRRAMLVQTEDGR